MFHLLQENITFHCLNHNYRLGVSGLMVSAQNLVLPGAQVENREEAHTLGFKRVRIACR